MSTGQIPAQVPPTRCERASLRRVLRQERLDAGLCRRQRRFGLPLRDELAVRQQLRELLRNWPRMRLVVACQYHAWRSHRLYEVAVGAIDEARGVEVPAERVE